MRLIKYFAIFSVIAGAGNAQAHDGDKTEQRVGLKSIEVIKNDIRLQGAKVISIQMAGSKAVVSTRVQNQIVKLSIDRQTGAIKQTQGNLRLDPALLSQGKLQQNPKIIRLFRPKIEAIPEIEVRPEIEKRPDRVKK